MNPQLEIVLELQDLKSQRRELGGMEGLEGELSAAGMEREVFRVETAQAITELDSKIAELEERLDPAVRERYRQVASTRGRGLVPVIGGVCYGCFMAVPSAVASAANRNKTLRWCDYCGCFLYFLG